MFRIRLFGRVAVERDGQELSMVRSRKTRALLAYLAVQDRAHSRNALCDLLWQDPADPRASLRWSLSKLRQVVDDAQICRVETARSRVRLRCDRDEVDVGAFRRRVTAEPATADNDALIEAVDLYTGPFADALELSDCYQFQAWQLAQRTELSRQYGRALEELVARLEHKPERALHYAHAWLKHDPRSQDAHLATMGLLGRLGRVDEALAQYERCRRMLRADSGTHPSYELEVARLELDACGRQSPDESGHLGLVDDDARELVDWLAACGRPIHPDTLLAITGEPAFALSAAIESLERQNVIESSDDGCIELAEATICAAIYDQLSAPRRQLIHRRIAHTLDERRAGIARLAEIVHHASLGGDERLAVEATLRAAHRAVTRFAWADVALLARHGLERVESLDAEQRGPLRLEFIELLNHPPVDVSGDHAVFDAIERAIGEAKQRGSRQELRQAFSLLAQIHYHRGDFGLALDHTLSAEQSGRPGNPVTVVQSLADTSRCLSMIEREPERAERLACEAARLAGHLHEELLAVPMALGLVEHYRGDHPAAAESFDDAAWLARRCAQLWWECSCRIHLPMMALEDGQTDLVLERIAQIEPLVEQLRDQALGHFLDALTALAHLQATQDALEEVDASIIGLEHVDSKWMLAYTENTAAQLLVDFERPQMAVTHARKALAAAEALGRGNDMVLAHVAASRARGALGATDLAREHAQKAYALADITVLSARAHHGLAGLPRAP